MGRRRRAEPQRLGTGRRRRRPRCCGADVGADVPRRRRDRRRPRRPRRRPAAVGAPRRSRRRPGWARPSPCDDPRARRRRHPPGRGRSGVAGSVTRPSPRRRPRPGGATCDRRRAGRRERRRGPGDVHRRPAQRHHQLLGVGRRDRLDGRVGDERGQGVVRRVLADRRRPSVPRARPTAARSSRASASSKSSVGMPSETSTMAGGQRPLLHRRDRERGAEQVDRGAEVGVAAGLEVLPHERRRGASAPRRASGRRSRTPIARTGTSACGLLVRRLGQVRQHLADRGVERGHLPARRPSTPSSRRGGRSAGAAGPAARRVARSCADLRGSAFRGASAPPWAMMLRARGG